MVLLKVYPVYKIKLSELYYNDQNDRIATWISKYKIENKITDFEKYNIETYNDKIGEFIKSSDEKAYKKTKNNIEAIGQQEPAIVLKDGRIIDGNRRFTCLRALAQNNTKFNYLESIIIDKDIENSKKEIKLLELYLQHGKEERVDYKPIDRLVGIYNDINKNNLITIKEYADNTGQSEKEVKQLLDRAILMNEFLEFINMPEHYYLARELDLDGPLNEINTILKKVKNDEDREDLKNILFTYLIMKPNSDMTRYVRHINKLVNNVQFKPFLEENLELTERFLEKFDEIEENPDATFINEKVKSDIELTTELNETYEKFQEKVKKRNTLNAPRNQVMKAIEALENIDSHIVISLNDEDHEQFLSALNELENTIHEFRKEVYGDA
ncbi:ParB/RepB/Spo0J family partition protein [Staphylococcus pseudintermedius]|uniref:ParB/RepB/Spo0J family partition protein n=1 Tax=Staphylococcus pseudintermedius TaxID=283734 RepID=UPI001938D745|nr:ParB/RepB/Spo0J family partition protein [Staphylococcus pseudintermedius]QQJ64106.1 ParB N-terminal domain-containing protein [Staphylococcus pseudintermedius]